MELHPSILMVSPGCHRITEGYGDSHFMLEHLSEKAC